MFETVALSRVKQFDSVKNFTSVPFTLIRHPIVQFVVFVFAVVKFVENREKLGKSGNRNGKTFHSWNSTIPGICEEPKRQ